MVRALRTRARCALNAQRGLDGCAGVVLFLIILPSYHGGYDRRRGASRGRRVCAWLACRSRRFGALPHLATLMTLDTHTALLRGPFSVPSYSGCNPCVTLSEQHSRTHATRMLRRCAALPTSPTSRTARFHACAATRAARHATHARHALPADCRAPLRSGLPRAARNLRTTLRAFPSSPHTTTHKTWACTPPPRVGTPAHYYCLLHPILQTSSFWTIGLPVPVPPALLLPPKHSCDEVRKAEAPKSPTPHAHTPPHTTPHTHPAHPTTPTHHHPH